MRCRVESMSLETEVVASMGLATQNTHVFRDLGPGRECCAR